MGLAKDFYNLLDTDFFAGGCVRACSRMVFGRLADGFYLLAGSAWVGLGWRGMRWHEVGYTMFEKILLPGLRRGVGLVGTLGFFSLLFPSKPGKDHKYIV